MSVLDRLAALREPVDFDGTYWEPLASSTVYALECRPRAIRFASYWLNRIRLASVALSLRHMFRRTNAGILAALSCVTPEMEWFKKVTAPSPAGKENRITLNVWGR